MESKSCFTKEEQKYIDEKMESYKRQIPLVPTASKSDGKQLQAEVEKFNKKLDNFCSKMGLSKEMLEDEKFMSAIKGVTNTVQKYRVEDFDDEEALLVNDGLSNDGENLVKFAECFAKYMKK